MKDTPNNESIHKKEEHLREAAEKTVTDISSNVRRKYTMIDLKKVPDYVKYSKVEKYLRSVNIEITRRMFISYINDEILPGGHKVKNKNFSFYTRDQIITYILIDMFKPILPLGKVKILLSEVLRPMISDMGVDSAFSVISEMIISMASRFEKTAIMAIEKELVSGKNNAKLPLDEQDQDEEKKADSSIAYYTNLVTLCMARGALDFYMLSPLTLLE